MENITYEQFCSSLDCIKNKIKSTFASPRNDQIGPKWIDASDNLSSGIVVYWEKIENADSYTLFRDGILVASNIINNSYEDTDIEHDKTYEYRVMALQGPCGSDLSAPDTGISPSDGYSFFCVCSVTEVNQTHNKVKFYCSHECDYDIGNGWVTVPNGLNSIYLDTSKIIKIKSKEKLSQIRFIEDEDTNTHYKTVQITYGNYVNTLEYICNDLKYLELFNFEGPCNVTNFNYAFTGCESLKHFEYMDTSYGIYFNSTWADCQNLETFPLLDMNNAEEVYNTWLNCKKLLKFPEINLPKVQILSFTWAWCESLTDFPLIDISSVHTVESAWRGTSIVNFPLLDFSNCNTLRNAWRKCKELKTFPLINTSDVVNFQGAWVSTEKLESFPNINVENGENFDFAWFNTGIKQFPDLNFYSAISFSSTWEKSKISYIGVISSGDNPDDPNDGVQNFQRTFYDCENLLCIKEINTATCDWSKSDLPIDDPDYFNPTENMFYGCDSLFKPNNLEIQDLTNKPGYHFFNDTQCPLTEKFLCEINVHNSNTNISLYISHDCTINNNGLIEELPAGENVITPFDSGTKLIITSTNDLTKVKFNSSNQSYNDNYKDITMSVLSNTLKDGDSMCFGLSKMINFSCSNINFTSLNSTFENCSDLINITVPNTSNILSLSSTFKNCISLTDVPDFEISQVNSFISTFEGCTSLKYIKGLKTTSGKYFDMMFKDCSNLECLEELDTRNKDYLHGVDIPEMFYGCDLLVAPNEIEQDALVDGNSSGRLWINDNLCPSLRPMPPKNFKASSDRWDGSLLTWEKVEDADFYRFFRDEDFYVGETSDPDTLEYLDTSCEEGIVYTYYCRSVKVHNGTEYESDTISNTDKGNIIIPEFDRKLDFIDVNMTEFIHKFYSKINSNNELEGNKECGDIIDLPPIAISDLSATDSECGKIIIRFTPSSGNPIPKNDLYKDGVLIAENINSNYELYNIPEGLFYIKSHNNSGSVESNRDEGSAITGPIKVTDFIASDNQCNEIVCTWSNTNADKYDLFVGNELISEDISSGYKLLNPLNEQREYYVRGYDQCGFTDSNANDGIPYWKPKPCTAFIASDGRSDGVYCIWDIPDDKGNPECTYDLYRDDIKILTNVPESGILDSSAESGVTYNYYVKTVNTCGESKSNENQGHKS